MSVGTVPALVASSVAAEGVSPETTQLFRAVEPGELADLVGSGQYRMLAGLEWKFFFPTQAQADHVRFAPVSNHSSRMVIEGAGYDAGASSRVAFEHATMLTKWPRLRRPGPAADLSPTGHADARWRPTC